MSRVSVMPRIAVVGVSSLIGSALIEELRARKFAYAELHALDDERNVGTALNDEEAKLPVGDVAAFDFSRVDLAFFCGRAALSERYAQGAAQHAWVIDGSAVFRARADVPLVAADVNPAELDRVGARGLIALPGSASVALATALAPLHALAGLARVEVATYQAVSGSGRGAMDELAGETVAMLSGKPARGRAFGRQIAFNVIPQVDAIEETACRARSGACGRKPGECWICPRSPSMPRPSGSRYFLAIVWRCMQPSSALLTCGMRSPCCSAGVV